MRRVEDYLNDPETTEAERRLIEACREGRDCKLNDGKRPEPDDQNPEHTVRATLIRLLAKGATPECRLHEAGVSLIGAQITGQLDLGFVKTYGILALTNCCFQSVPRMEEAELYMLSLSGSSLPGLIAQGIQVKSSVFLRSIITNGPINIVAARIGGQLDFEGADLYGKYVALNMEAAVIKNVVILRHVKIRQGRVNLTSAHAGSISDDPSYLNDCDSLTLDGFKYDAIYGHMAAKTFERREAWLRKGSFLYSEFRPQPYTQFAKVMRASGHLGEVRKALMARDTILFREAEKADRELLAKTLPNSWTRRWERSKIRFRLHRRKIWASLSRRVIGHGHKPDRALFWALGFWGVGTLLYFCAYSCGLMVPNSDVIMVSADWLAAVAANPDAPTVAWTQDAVLSSKHYESFFAAIYALDLFLPIVDLGQESTWAVTTPTTFGWGWWLRVGTLLYQIAGWVVVSLGIAAVTGFVQRNDPE